MREDDGVKPWLLIGVSVAFVAVASFLAPERAWIEAVSESFVPYGAVPLAVGYAASRSRIVGAAVLGALASVSMVVAFYVVRPLLGVAPAVPWTDVLYWSSIGAVSGALLAAVSWSLRPRVSRHTRLWTLGTCLFLSLLPVIFFLYTGWGRVAVDTGSGVVTVGYSTTDVVVATFVLAAFDCGVMLFATREGGRRVSRLHER